MDYLFAQSDKIQELLGNKFIFLFLDYDGTLTAIAPTPQEAVLPQEVRRTLQKLSLRPDCKIGIISGRALKDLKNAVGIENIIYAGNHGLEIEGPKLKFESRVSPQFKSVIRQVAEDLSKELKDIKGALIENKGLTLSIHYRLVDNKDIPLFEKIFYAAVAPYRESGKIKVDRGKKVYEIRPPVHWDKGKAVLWLLARQQFAIGDKKVFPVYLGDDKTDEYAFRALKGKGATVLVGDSGSSVADYYLKDSGEVVKFFNLILKTKK